MSFRVIWSEGCCAFQNHLAGSFVCPDLGDVGISLRALNKGLNFFALDYHGFEVCTNTTRLVPFVAPDFVQSGSNWEK